MPKTSEGVGVTELVIVRHGETELNRDGVFRGRLDVPLNDRGRLQAEAAAEALSGKPVAAVFSSPLSRALDTGAAIARRHGVEVIVDEAFHNFDLGVWQGRPKEVVRSESPELWDTWVNDPARLRIPGGETLDDVRGRALSRALGLVEEHRGERIVIATHRSVAKLLGGALLGLGTDSFWSFYLDNAGYSIFGHGKRGFVLLTWNEAAHLGERVVELF
ncbi:MAG: histidine phosphatase family protein [Candidatus Eisenbacteria bacterium]|nr:histidine phosphatase family protein [Candidatus Eisenbacteria bacterium]